MKLPYNYAIPFLITAVGFRGWETRQFVNTFHIPEPNVNAYLEYEHSSTTNSMKQSSS
jgi:hypothetical protein